MKRKIGSGQHGKRYATMCDGLLLGNEMLHMLSPEDLRSGGGEMIFAQLMIEAKDKHQKTCCYAKGLACQQIRKYLL